MGFDPMDFNPPSQPPTSLRNPDSYIGPPYFANRHLYIENIARRAPYNPELDLWVSAREVAAAEARSHHQEGDTPIVGNDEKGTLRSFKRPRRLPRQDNGPGASSEGEKANDILSTRTSKAKAKVNNAATADRQEEISNLPQAPAPRKVLFPPTSRAKPAPPGDEETTSVLKMGEFENVDTLTLSETALVLNALTTKRRAERKNVNDTEMLTKTLDYLDAFARFKEKESVEAVERLLSSHKNLHKFERAQLGSLCCETAEEAKTLVPSLQDKISDEDLQELLDEMYKLMGR